MSGMVSITISLPSGTPIYVVRLAKIWFPIDSVVECMHGKTSDDIPV